MSTDANVNSGAEPTPTVVDDTEHGRAHSLAVHLSIVLGAVVLLITAVNVWVDRAALNTDNWVDAADELLADPEVRSAVSTYVVDQLYLNVDVSTSLENLLPTDLSGLSGPLAAALRNPATDAVDRLLSTPAAATVWSDANRITHAAIVKILEDDGDVVTSADGAVTLDLRELVVQLATTLGLPGTVIDRVPADVGQVAVVQSSTLADLQTAVTFVQWASWLLLLVVIAIFVGAVALATDWRRVATRNVGISVVIVGLVLVASQRVGGERLLDHVVKVDSNRPTAEAVWRIGSELLRDIAWTITCIGAVLIIGAALAGSTRAARAIRSFVAPAFTGSPAIRWGIGAVVFLVLVWWAPLPALTTFLGMIVTAAIIAACIEGLRGQCLHDAVEAERDADIADAIVTERVDARP